MIALRSCPTRTRVIPTDRNRNQVEAPAPAPRDAKYLRRWITHQAVLYNDLLQTIAAAPSPDQHGHQAPHLPRG